MFEQYVKTSHGFHQIIRDDRMFSPDSADTTTRSFFERRYR